MFGFHIVWEDIRPRGNETRWTHIVWFSHCVPRHAFHLWLVMKRKLKTQDLLRQWDVSPSTNLNLIQCPLCDSQPDSHNHLFFDCSYSSQVWFGVVSRAGMDIASCSLDTIVSWLIPIAEKRSVLSIVAKLVLAASTYFIWQERNSRLFMHKKRSQDQLVDVIFTTVRLKLCTFKFKKTRRVENALEKWNLSYALIQDRVTST